MYLHMGIHRCEHHFPWEFPHDVGSAREPRVLLGIFDDQALRFLVEERMGKHDGRPWETTTIVFHPGKHDDIMYQLLIIDHRSFFYEWSFLAGEKHNK